MDVQFTVPSLLSSTSRYHSDREISGVSQAHVPQFQRSRVAEERDSVPVLWHGLVDASGRYDIREGAMDIRNTPGDHQERCRRRSHCCGERHRFSRDCHQAVGQHSGCTARA